MAGLALIRRGHDPFIPHLAHYLDEFAQAYDVNLPAEFWYRYDFQWMPLCEAGFYLGASPGADAERRILESLQRPIYTSLHDVPDLTLPGQKI